MQFATVALAAFAGFASAQQQGSTKIHVVMVGQGGQKFSPEKVIAAAGDVVQFQFVGGNHTATQSTFTEPCQPISNFGAVQGFHSGFPTGDPNLAQGMTPTFSVLVNDTKPIWAYCAQGKHCEGGMVMVINENTAANSSRSLEQYKLDAAKASTVVPNGNGGNGGTAGNTGNGGNNGGNGGNNGVPAGAMALAAPTTFSLVAVFAALFML